MEHHFNVKIACKLGVEKATLIHNLAFWIKKNVANKVNFHDGYYWTYNTAEAFGELLPYFSSRKIGRFLNDLETAGVIKSGNYNKIQFDRTKWYTITDENILELYEIPNTKNCIPNYQKWKMEVPKNENGITESVQPIPYNNTDSKTKDNNKSKKENNKQLRKQQFEEWYNRYGCFEGNRVTAEKHFMKLSDEQVEKVNRYTDYYLTTDTVKNGYIMYPNNFLRTKQYENPILSNNKDAKPSIDTKIVRRIENIEILLDSRNMIYAKDKDFLEDILTNDLYSKYRYILDKIHEANIV